MSTIWHHGAWNRNFGDWVLFDSIQTNLQKSAGRSLHFVPVDSQRTIYRDELIAKMNAEADMLLIGGGGLIFNRPEDNSCSGWQLNLRLEDISKIEIPIVIYGIGYNRFPYDRNDFPPVLNDHLKAIQEKAALFSVRNEGTRREVLKRGLSPGKLEVVMDAGAFAPSAPITVSGLDPTKKIIGLNIAGDRPAHRFPGTTASPEEEEQRCYELLADALAEVAEAENAQVLFLPHLLEIDEAPREIFRSRIGKRFVCLREALPQLYPPAPATAGLLIGAYDLCDLVIGMRGHACIIPFGRKVPFIALGAHAKTSFLLEDIDLPGYRLSTDGLLDGSLTQAQTTALLRKGLADADIPVKIEKALAKAREGFDDWNRKVIELLPK